MTEGYRLPGDPNGEAGTCKDCRCWHYDTMEAPEGGTMLKLSQCRRYPPALDPAVAPWPWAKPDEWCGEFRL